MVQVNRVCLKILFINRPQFLVDSNVLILFIILFNFSAVRPIKNSEAYYGTASYSLSYARYTENLCKPNANELVRFAKAQPSLSKAGSADGRK